MIRPIRVAPLSQTRMISENPLVPNQMSNQQYLANQFASGAYAQPTAMATSRPMPQPVSPVADLAQLGQAGLQGSQNQQRTASKVSQRVGGLLGGDQQGVGGLLSDVQGEAALQGLFATMQAIGRPVRRGEDRFIGATQYGQQVMDAAQKRGMQDLSTRMQLEKFAKEQQIADARRAALADMQSPAQVGLENVFTEYEIQQMSGAQKSLASQAEAMRQKGLQLMSVDPSSQIGKELLDQSEKLRSNALTGIRTRTDQAQEEKNLRAELAPSLKQANEVASKHNSLINLTDQAMQGSFVSGYGAVVQALKALEPNSAVLSSEYDSATSLAGAVSRALQFFEGNVKGEMTPEMAQSLRDVASAAAKTAMDVRANVEEQYAPIVEENFLRPEQVFLKPIPLTTAPRVYDFGGASQQRKGEDAARAAAEELISTMDGGA